MITATRAELERLCDQLQITADEVCEEKIKEIKAYYNGYKQGCEDLFKDIRRFLMMDDSQNGNALDRKNEPDTD